MPQDHHTTIAAFRDQLNSHSAKMSLCNQELSIEFDAISLRPIGTDIIAGVATELPAGFRVCDLLEAVRIGEANFVKILEALATMATTSSRFDQKFALDAAHAHLADFSRIIIGVLHCRKPVPADIAASAES